MGKADRKFSGLASLRAGEPTAEPTAAPNSAPVEQPVAIEQKPPKTRGRPRGKRSNPDWKLYSHFLKKQTQRDADSVLRNLDEGRDLSDLLQELLEQWLTSHRKA